jgi:hypothetical protein
MVRRPVLRPGPHIEQQRQWQQRRQAALVRTPCGVDRACSLFAFELVVYLDDGAAVLGEGDSLQGGVFDLADLRP